MSEEILARDIPLSWDCPYCGAEAARYGYIGTLKAAQCKPGCPKAPPPSERNEDNAPYDQ